MGANGNRGASCPREQGLGVCVLLQRLGASFRLCLGVILSRSLLPQDLTSPADSFALFMFLLLICKAGVRLLLLSWAFVCYPVLILISALLGCEAFCFLRIPGEGFAELLLPHCFWTWRFRKSLAGSSRETRTLGTHVCHTACCEAGGRQVLHREEPGKGWPACSEWGPCSMVLDVCWEPGC